MICFVVVTREELLNGLNALEVVCVFSVISSYIFIKFFHLIRTVSVFNPEIFSFKVENSK